MPRAVSFLRRRSKFGAIPTVIDGIKFASKREAARYNELALLQKAGMIRNLKLQVTIPLIVNEIKICSWRADFTYEEKAGTLTNHAWLPIWEDCKGYRTPEYRLKAKLVRAIYGVAIRET